MPASIPANDGSIPQHRYKVGSCSSIYLPLDPGLNPFCPIQLFCYCTRPYPYKQSGVFLRIYSISYYITRPLRRVHS